MFAPKANPSVEIYSEDPGEFGQASKEDINEFAKRIGIDVDKEPHLLYLAEDGIEEKLPPFWKPCYDCTKEAWYYYNQATKISQWEHPLNEVYRAKVTKVRTDLAMNRIQTFDPSISRPPQSLPPLKKPGSGRPPTGLSRLGPLEGSKTLNKSLSNTDFQPPRDRVQTASLGDLQNRSDNSDNSQSLKNPSGRMVKKPLGLTLTEEEKKIVRELGSGYQKQGVKFKLDENPALNFEISETDENDASEGKESGESETEEDISDEVDNEDEGSDSSPFGRIKSTTGRRTSQKSDSELEHSRGNMGGAGEKVTSNSNMSEAAVEARKATMRKNMEAKLKEYQDELDKERRDREDQIKKHMDMTVEQLKVEKESDIKKRRSDLEQTKNIELDKIKRELESAIKAEVEKMKLSFDKELEKKKAEIREEHEKILDGIGRDLSSEPLDEENQNSELRRKYSEETLKLHADLKNHKEAMKDEQKKQIQQMKDYHKSFIDKLKAEMKAEEKRLQNEHQLQISGIMSTFEKETAEIQAKLKSEQDLTLKRLMTEFEKEKSSVERELKDGIMSLNNDMKTLKSKVEASEQSEIANQPHRTTKTEEELKSLSAKYHQLERKYVSLKKELRKISAVDNHTQTPSKRQSNESIQNVSKSEPVSNSLHEVSERSESDSQTETSFYPSSSVNRPQDKQVSENEENDYANETKEERDYRLGCALKSLDILRGQILEIKQDQVLVVEKALKSLTPKSSARAGSPIKHSKKTARHASPVSSSRSAKKKNTNQITGPKTTKKNSPVTPPPTRTGRIRQSRSFSELREVVENSESNEIVKEAKEFIRSQKERLSVPSETKFDKQNSTSWSTNNAPRYSLDEISYPPVSATRNYNHSPKPDPFSETESSGVGSLKDLKSSQEKKQISKDIEAICSSLSHLDGQMRLMWSVVQGNDKTNVLNQNNVVANSLPNHVPTGKPSSRKHSNQRPVTSLDLQSLAPAVLTSSNRAFIDSIKATNLPSSRMSASNLLSSLDKELKEFKAAKERILNQYTNQKNTPTDGIQEKTKDLREWLEKF